MTDRNRPTPPNGVAIPTLPRITAKFLADCERMATKTIEENGYQNSQSLKAGSMVLLVNPENQLAMVKRIRDLENLLGRAIGELRDTGGLFALDIAKAIESESGIE